MVLVPYHGSSSFSFSKKKKPQTCGFSSLLVAGLSVAASFIPVFGLEAIAEDVESGVSATEAPVEQDYQHLIQAFMNKKGQDPKTNILNKVFRRGKKKTKRNLHEGIENPLYGCATYSATNPVTPEDRNFERNLHEGVGNPLYGCATYSATNLVTPEDGSFGSVDCPPPLPPRQGTTSSASVDVENPLYGCATYSATNLVTPEDGNFGSVDCPPPLPPRQGTTSSASVDVENPLYEDGNFGSVDCPPPRPPRQGTTSSVSVDVEKPLYEKAQPGTPPNKKKQFGPVSTTPEANLRNSKKRSLRKKRTPSDLSSRPPSPDTDSNGNAFSSIVKDSVFRAKLSEKLQAGFPAAQTKTTN